MNLADFTRTYIGTTYDGGDDWNTTVEQEVDSGNMWDLHLRNIQQRSIHTTEMYASENNH